MSTDSNHDDAYEVRDIEPVTMGTLDTMGKIEADVAVMTAKRYPRFWAPFGRDRGRGVADFQNEVVTYACADQEMAEACFYRLPRRTKDGRKIIIEGGSIRLAEIVAGCWRNIYIGTQIAPDADNYVTAVGGGWDLERNLKAGTQVRRRIVDHNGKRYNEDLIQQTTNALQSIAYRNLVFRIVPRSLLAGPIVHIREIAAGKGRPMDQRRTYALKKLSEVGAAEREVLNFLGCKSVVDITEQHLADLTGIFAGIKEGESSWFQIYRDWVEEQKAGVPDPDPLPPIHSIKREVQPPPPSSSQSQPQAAPVVNDESGAEPTTLSEVQQIALNQQRKKLKLSLEDLRAAVISLGVESGELDQLAATEYDALVDALTSRAR
jgi:hypothetical protein